MSAHDITCDLEHFAASIKTLYGDIPEVCEAAAGKATEQATRAGVGKVKSHASKGGLHPWSDRYVGGFKSHIERGAVTVGEIGNANEPGLVHLLEKGHATPAGRRTRAYPHMDPAWSEIQEDFIERVSDAVWRAIS